MEGRSEAEVVIAVCISTVSREHQKDGRIESSQHAARQN